MRTANVGQVRRARALRRELSPPELKLWLELKAASEGRCAWRRQHAMGSYVLDFYCAALRLAVEIDGNAHGAGDRPQRDARRDAWLALHGVEVMRISAASVLANAGEIAWSLIVKARERGSPPPSASRPPPPQAGEV